MRIDVNPEYGYSSVVLGTPIPDEYKDIAFFDLDTDYYSLPMINITVEPLSVDNPDAQAAQDNQLKHIKTSYNNYRMLSQKLIMVSGIECTQIEYSCTKPDWSQPVIYTDIFFDYNDYIWRIYTAPQEDEAEKYETAFEQVVESLIILDKNEITETEYKKLDWADEKVNFSFEYPSSIYLVNA